ncbi:hypothetical protein FSARC_13870, partial [Fusarium sarcochroum]
AVSEFEAALTSEQKVSFRASRTAAASNGPTMSDVMRLTAEIDLKTTSRHGRGRCFGPRLTNMLEAIQKFAALGDVVVGGSQNLIACGVWAAARMTVHVVTGYLTYLEKLSALFMVVGRTAPRHHAMAAIYPQSKNLQRYLCEYFIIVTKICHQSITWTRKSAISRLSSTISDPELKNFQSDLDGWSSAIKEEATLLLNQKVDEEVKESARFRSLTKFGSETSAHQDKIKKCIRFLDACSQYDYRTTWKQTRKCGTTCLLQSCYGYDGLDECEMEEQRTVLRYLSWIQPSSYKLCLSVRTPEQNTIWKRRSFQFCASIPGENPDISDYVQIEVDNRVRDGTLVTRDPGLVQDIKQELIDGADGMFLWVSLQLESLCAELSDNDIREAIHDLPLDLTETFERNLKRANSNDSKGHHKQIFKLLVGARQLLTTEELREAASVTIGQAIWNTDQHISNIYAALKFCGSLVMVDEEDDTVRFIHHSARSFCLNSPRNAAEWTFTEDEADKTMAETVVTYLSNNVFETRVSRNVIPKIDANSMPKKVVMSTMHKHAIRSNVAGKFLSLQSHINRDIGPVLAEASSRWNNVTPQFFFLSYARNNWIQHTSHLEDLTSVPQWHRLLDHPTFGVDVTDVSVRYLPNFRMRPARDRLGASPNMIWALINGHILLLKHELTKDQGVRRIQAYTKLWILLRLVELQTFQNIDYHLVKWLSPMFVSLRMNHPAKPYLLRRLSVFDDCYVYIVQKAVSASDTDAVTTLLRRDNLDQSHLSLASPPLIQVAVSSGNASISRLLVEKGIARDLHINSASLIRAITSDLPDALVVRLVHSLLLAGIDYNTLSESQLYLVIHILYTYASFHKVSMVFQGLSDLHSGLRPRMDDLILHKACRRGDLQMASIFLSRPLDPDTSKFLGSCIDAALHGISQDRLGLVWYLLKCMAHPSPTAVARAIRIQQWAFALCFLSYQTESDHSDLCVNDVDWDDIDLAVLGNDTLGAPTFIRATPGLKLLSISQNLYHITWQFYYTADVCRKDKWRLMSEAYRQRLKHAIRSTYSPPHAPDPQSWYKDDCKTVHACFTLFDQPVIELVKPETLLTHVLRLNVPNPLPIVEELSVRWRFLYNDENSPIESCNDNPKAIWEGLDRRNGLGRRLLHESLDDFNRRQELIDERRRHNCDQLRSGLADAQWAVRRLTQAFGLLQNLPTPSNFYSMIRTVPAFHLPGSRQWHLTNVRIFSFCFAYMSVRIQWLRTLGLLFRKRLLNNIMISEELRLGLGDMAAILPALQHVSLPPTDHHKIMPSVLEAAFLGLEGKHILRTLMRKNTLWILEVVPWIEQMDPGIFTWAMGQDAPLSFRRAFQSFRKSGATESEIEMLEQALKSARAKVAELE